MLLMLELSVRMTRRRLGRRRLITIWSKCFTFSQEPLSCSFQELSRVSYNYEFIGYVIRKKQCPVNSSQSSQYGTCMACAHLQSFYYM